MEKYHNLKNPKQYHDFHFGISWPQLNATQSSEVNTVVQKRTQKKPGLRNRKHKT